MPTLNEMIDSLPEDMTIGGYEIFNPSETRPEDRPGIEVGADGGDRLRIVVWDRWADEGLADPTTAFTTGYVIVRGEPADRERVLIGLRDAIVRARAVLADTDPERALRGAIDASHAVGDWRERIG